MLIKNHLKSLTIKKFKKIEILTCDETHKNTNLTTWEYTFFIHCKTCIVHGKTL